MNETKSLEELALTTLHKLNPLLLEAVLVKKSLSKSNMEAICTPIASLDWEGKSQYANQLITILETSKTEAEILERASKITLK